MVIFHSYVTFLQHFSKSYGFHWIHRQAAARTKLLKQRQEKAETQRGDFMVISLWKVRWFNGDEIRVIYPLVNVYITMERSTIL